jgi:hypothetical protein
LHTNRRLSYLVVVLLFLGSCSLDGLASHLIGSYEGRLPCADCPGIIMTMELKEKGRYESKLVYLERNTRIEENGVWRISEKSKNGGLDSTVLELSADGSKGKTYLLLKNNTTFELLGSDKKPLPGSELRKQVY